jgi:hypothetical protein
MIQRPTLAVTSIVLLFGCTTAADNRTPPAASLTSVSVGNRTEEVDRPSPTPAVTDSTTRELFRRVMDTADGDGFDDERIGRVMQEVGLLFVGSAYEGGLLDAPEEEELLVSLDRFDCVLFVETVLALSQGIVSGDRTFDGFVGRIERLRYRDGQMDGYCSRLHYFSEWIYDNEKKGAVQNITLALGGSRVAGKLDFMSRNRDLYARFAGNDSLFQGIRRMEDSLATLDRWYIPQGMIRSIYPSLQAGDVVATSTTVEGLDVSHSGLVFENPQGGIGFLHASTKNGVTVADDLADYVMSNSATFGIVVARPVNPPLPYD